MRMTFEGKKEKSKNRWLETIESDIRASAVCVGHVGNRDKWRFRTKVAKGQREEGKREEEE